MPRRGRRPPAGPPARTSPPGGPATGPGSAATTGPSGFPPVVGPNGSTPDQRPRLTIGVRSMRALRTASRPHARPTGPSSNRAAAASSSQTCRAAYRVRSASPGPKPVPVPVPSSLPKRIPGVWRSRRRSTAIRLRARGTRAARHPPHVQRDQRRRTRVFHATSVAVPAVTRSSSAQVVGKTAWGTPPAAQIDVVLPQGRVDERAHRFRVAERGDAADGLTGVLADELRGGPAQLRHAETGGDLCGVDPVRAGREHQQGLAVRVEDQRVGDLPDGDAERLGRRGRGVHALGQYDHLRQSARGGPRPGGVECVLDRLHVGMWLHDHHIARCRPRRASNPGRRRDLHAGGNGDRVEAG